MAKTSLIVAAAVVFTFAACAPSRHRPSESGADVLAIQSRLSEAEEKIDRLAQRLALIQIIVDSHQRTLQDLAGNTAAGNSNAGTPRDADADTPPASSTPETEMEPVASRPLPPVFETEEAHPVSDAAPFESSPDLHEPEIVSPDSPPGPQEPEIVSPEPLPEHREPEIVSPEPPSEPLKAETAPLPESEKRLVVPEPNPLYQEAMEIFRSGDYETAAGLFVEFARQFPKDDLADNALYWSGECRYARKDYTGALTQFRQVIDDYPSGSKAPDALLKIGFAYLSLGDTESAVTYLRKVVAQYPFSPAGAKAEERLKTLQD